MILTFKVVGKKKKKKKKKNSIVNLKTWIQKAGLKILPAVDMRVIPRIFSYNQLASNNA